MQKRKADSHFERRDQMILNTVRAVRPRVLINQLGRPSIMLPLSTKSEERSEYPIRHSRVEAELAYLIYVKTGLSPHQTELNRIIKVLEGRAWRINRSDLDLITAIDSDPLLETLYIYLHDESSGGRSKGSCSKLLKELTHLATAHGLDITNSDWPKGSAQLSHHLWKNRRLLNSSGIKISRGRYPGGNRFIKLQTPWQCDAEQSAASQQRHNTNTLPHHELESAGADDGAVGGIFDRIAAPSGETNERDKPNS
jgi:hypothetical protein